MENVSEFIECPRCGEESFERLASYAHCPNCLYVEDYWEDNESRHNEALQKAKEMVADVVSIQNLVRLQKGKRLDRKDGAQVIPLGAGA